MFFSRKRSDADLETGSLHVREVGGRAIEQAEVVDVSPDGMGIPHVRFRITHIKNSRSVCDGLRVLAVSCFRERYRRIEQAA